MIDEGEKSRQEAVIQPGRGSGGYRSGSAGKKMIRMDRPVPEELLQMGHRVVDPVTGPVEEESLLEVDQPLPDLV